MYKSSVGLVAKSDVFGLVKKKKKSFPYKYWDSSEKFHNSLNRREISDEDYEHAEIIWKIFRMKHMRKYHDL